MTVGLAIPLAIRVSENALGRLASGCCALPNPGSDAELLTRLEFANRSRGAINATAIAARSRKATRQKLPNNLAHIRGEFD